MVGAAGFELAAPCSQSRCSTKLSYAPYQWRLVYNVIFQLSSLFAAWYGWPPWIQKNWAMRIAEAVQARLGRVDATVSTLIAQEVAGLLSEDPTAGSSTLADPGLRQEVAPEGESALTERVVVSANGRNKAGVAATLTQVISDFGGDIRDISQTIVGPYFTMIIVVDIAGATSGGAHFADFKSRLGEVGQKAGFHVVTLHDDLLTAMHNV